MKHVLLILTALLVWLSAEVRAENSRYQPVWASIPPKRVIRHQNTDGDALVRAVASLRPGDQLTLAAGTYSVNRLWDIGVSGTAEAPIWIVAEEGAKVVLTRPDARQNVLNIGQGGPVHHLCLRGVEITGGSHGLRLGRGLEDFTDATWDGVQHDVTPVASAPFEHAEARYLLESDFAGAKRTRPLSGARTR